MLERLTDDLPQVHLPTRVPVARGIVDVISAKLGLELIFVPLLPLSSPYGASFTANPSNHTTPLLSRTGVGWVRQTHLSVQSVGYGLLIIIFYAGNNSGYK